MINTDKAYILGLLVGGGILQNDTLQIILPYKKWGDIEENVARGGSIAKDILSRLQPRLKTSYDIDVHYKIGTDWTIFSNKISNALTNDLQDVGLPIKGELRSLANLNKLIPKLTSKEHKKSFITGLVDTIGSMAGSHRRFTDNFQIISLEFKGNNYPLVADVIKILGELDVIPDQVLWNHPNQHSAKDRYYTSWKKGFKIRVCLDDYLINGGFFFSTKKQSAQENKAKQVDIHTAQEKEYSISGRVTLHIDENCVWLPQNIRGYHFIHNLHYAKFLGIPTPASFNMDYELEHFERFFCPFTCLTKGTLDEISNIIETEDYLTKTIYAKIKVNPVQMLADYDDNPNIYFQGNSSSDGFPLSYVMQGLAYMISTAIGGKLKGKRVPGNFYDVIKTHMSNEKSLEKLGIKIFRPNKGTCLLIKSSSHAVLIGYINDSFNKKLIIRESKYKIMVTNPSFSDCVKL